MVSSPCSPRDSQESSSAPQSRDLKIQMLSHSDPNLFHLQNWLELPPDTLPKGLMVQEPFSGKDKGKKILVISTSKKFTLKR